MIDIDTLRQVQLFAGLSNEQLQWLVEQGTEVWASTAVLTGCYEINSIQNPKSKIQNRFSYPILKSFEPGEDWSWCYIDKTYI